MPFVDQAIEAYAEAHTTQVDDRLQRLDDETHASLSWPEMLAGPVVGRLLETLVWATRARLVVEVGTYSGYSALSMAAALPPGGRVVTLEVSDEHADFAQRHVDASPYADRVEIRRGPALASLASIDGPIDLAFIDADKSGYVDYYEAILPKLADHGLILADNTLRNGRIVDPENDGDHALARFNDHVLRDERVVVTQLTVRDGVALIRRR
ncbi:MAG: O-methyltransferase [Solirubrobacterales bacterium]|nr:O-methyltransferase [Solirubrobacterales bacterium]